MTAYEKIAAEACEWCRGGSKDITWYLGSDHGTHDGWVDRICTAPSKDAVIERLAAENKDLKDWARAAHQFAWAHERSCPRHDTDSPCSCGLDRFLSRPRPFVEGLRAENKRLREALVEIEDISSGICGSASDHESAREIRVLVRAALAGPAQETEA